MPTKKQLFLANLQVACISYYTQSLVAMTNQYNQRQTLLCLEAGMTATDQAVNDSPLDPIELTFAMVNSYIKQDGTPKPF